MFKFQNPFRQTSDFAEEDFQYQDLNASTMSLLKAQGFIVEAPSAEPQFTVVSPSNINTSRTLNQSQIESKKVKALIPRSPTNPYDYSGRERAQTFNRKKNTKIPETKVSRDNDLAGLSQLSRSQIIYEQHEYENALSRDGSQGMHFEELDEVP